MIKIAIWVHQTMYNKRSKLRNKHDLISDCNKIRLVTTSPARTK